MFWMTLSIWWGKIYRKIGKYVSEGAENHDLWTPVLVTKMYPCKYSEQVWGRVESSHDQVLPTKNALSGGYIWVWVSLFGNFRSSKENPCKCWRNLLVRQERQLYVDVDVSHCDREGMKGRMKILDESMWVKRSGDSSSRTMEVQCWSDGWSESVRCGNEVHQGDFRTWTRNQER